MGLNKFLYFAICGLVYITSINCLPSMKPCSKERCPQTEYSAYIKCMTGHSRSKRQAPCYYDYQISGPDCQARYRQCVQTCTYAIGCNIRCPPCPLQPPSQVHIMQQQPPIPSLSQTSNRTQGHNITTIIHLTNQINNTNIVHVPTSINNTNINNISFNETEQAADEPIKDNCCIIVYKHHCSYGHCRHSRRKACGPQCEAKVIHSNSYLHCHGSNCKSRRIYIPQPDPSSCIHSKKWPYVKCGQRERHMQKKCHGCYDHYGHNYEEFYSEYEASECEGCYDDGYDNGPLYRHGPLYQPGYYHQPRIPLGVFYQPIIYPMLPMYVPPYMNMMKRRQMKKANDFYDEDESEEYDYVDASELNDSGTKCRIVSNNGTRYACDHDVHNKNIYAKNKHDSQNHLH